MDYRISLPLLGLLLIGFGLFHQGYYLLAVWLGANFLVLGISHLYRWSRVFGKQPDGKLPLWSWILFLPLHLLTLGTWHLARILIREDACNHITDNLVIGRRMLSFEVDPSFDVYLDLTAEFPEVTGARNLAGYRCYPILDGSFPTMEQMDQILALMVGEKIFVHCAQGHGRSGMVAIAYLLKTGVVASVEQGLALVQSKRPALDLGKRQLHFIREYVEHCREVNSSRS
jgi:protein-tyrosine phosphatase